MDIKVRLSLTLLVILLGLIAILIFLPTPTEAQGPWGTYWELSRQASEEGDYEMARNWAAFAAYEVQKSQEWETVEIRPAGAPHDPGWWHRQGR